MSLRWQLKSKKDKTHQVLFEYHQNCLKEGVEKFALRSINVLIIFGIRRNCLRSRKSLLLYLSIRRVIQQIVVIIEAYNFCQLLTKFYPASCCQGSLHMERKLLGFISVDFDTTGQLLIIYPAFVKYLISRPIRRTVIFLLEII